MSHCDRNHCPRCGTPWLDPREMPIVLFEENRAAYPTMEKAEEAAESYGWTKENKIHPGMDVVGIQYSHTNPNRYDGISEWQCGKCKVRIGRWTGKQIADGEFEPRFGGM